MKILLISHIFPPAIDGGSRVIYKLGQHFESQKHSTLYLSSNCLMTDNFVNPKSKKELPDYKNFIKLPVYKRLRRPLKLISLLFTKQSYFHDLLKVLQKGPIFKVIPFIKIISKVKKYQPDLIIAGPLPTTIILYAKFFKKITKAKLLINSSFHQDDPDFHKVPLIKTLQQSDFLWTLTNYESNYFIKKFKINPKKIINVGNGTDFKFKKNKKIITKKTKQILFIGSLSAHKKVDFLIKAFSFLVLSNKTDINLTIVGQKTLFYPKIKKIYQSLKPEVKKKINFKLNISDQKELIKIIDQSTVLVLPSIQESFGLVLIESWTRSIPVITSDIPSLKEIVTKSKGGLFFKKNNQKDLEDKIKKIINNPRLAQQLGKNGQSYVKNNYIWKKVGQKIWQQISL